MSAENKALVRRYLEEGWNQRNLAVLDEIFAPNHVSHDPNTPDMGQGPDAVRKTVEFYLAAFPDTRFTIEDMVAEGDRVVTRWSVRGTHKGELQGIQPTNKQIEVTGISSVRCENGKIAESYLQWDAMGMMQQLGALSKMGGKASRRGA